MAPEQRTGQQAADALAQATQPIALSDLPVAEVHPSAPGERTDILRIPTSASRRVRARLARRMTAQRGG
ncbi:MAG TPA: hypothetical protein VFR17_04720, partial [Mycobacterium sp.]|nr:hypothetical protein [Mycobacterium sp.]